jgi:uncharacterized protein
MKTLRFFSILFLLVILFSQSSNAQMMSADQTKQIVKESYAALSNHDIDKFASYIADDAVDYGQGPEPIKGKTAILEGLKGFFGAFPDYKIVVEDIAISGNRVYIKNTFTGTQTKPLMIFPATGKMIKWSDTDIVEIDGKGKIAAHWANNPNEPLYQLGFGAFVNPNTSVIMAAYDAFGKGDIAGILSNCTDDVVFDITDGVFLPKGKLYKGKSEVPNFFKYLSETVQFTKFDPYQFLADGDNVVAYIKGEYKDLKTGKMSSANIVHQFKLVNGKVSWLKGTTDLPMDMAMSMKK